METTELKVTGMTCGACVASVTKALKRVPGVADVQVDLASGLARVTADEASSRAPAFVAALTDAGYVATSSSGETPARAKSGAGACHTQDAGRPKGHGCCCH